MSIYLGNEISNISIINNLINGSIIDPGDFQSNLQFNNNTIFGSFEIKYIVDPIIKNNIIHGELKIFWSDRPILINNTIYGLIFVGGSNTAIISNNTISGYLGVSYTKKATIKFNKIYTNGSTLEFIGERFTIGFNYFSNGGNYTNLLLMNNRGNSQFDFYNNTLVTSYRPNAINANNSQFPINIWNNTFTIQDYRLPEFILPNIQPPNYSDGSLKFVFTQSFFYNITFQEPNPDTLLVTINGSIYYSQNDFKLIEEAGQIIGKIPLFLEFSQYGFYNIEISLNDTFKNTKSLSIPLYLAEKDIFKPVIYSLDCYNYISWGKCDNSVFVVKSNSLLIRVNIYDHSDVTYDIYGNGSLWVSDRNSYSVSLSSNRPEGLYNISLVVYDTNNNSQTEQFWLEIREDIFPPLISPLANRTVIQYNKETIFLQISDDNIVLLDIYQNGTLVYDNLRGNFISFQAPIGVYNMTIVAFDSFNNVARAQFWISVIKEVKVPKISELKAFINQAVPSFYAKFLVSDTAGDGGTISLYHKDVRIYEYSYQLNYQSEWFVIDTQIPAIILEESSYTFSLILVDYNGYQLNYTFNIDDVRSSIPTSKNTLANPLIDTKNAANRTAIKKPSPFFTVNGFEWNIVFVLLVFVVGKKSSRLPKNIN